MMNEDKILQAIDALSKQIDERFTGIEERLNNVDNRLDKIEIKIDTLHASTAKEIREVASFIYDHSATKEDLEAGLEVLSNRVLRQELEVNKLKRIK